MPEHVVSILIKKMLEKDRYFRRKILIMGMTFKENCPDTRNSKVFEVIESLENYGVDINWFDPWIGDYEARKIAKWKRVKDLSKSCYDAIIIAVPHSSFSDLGLSKIKSAAKDKSVLFDLKAMFNRTETDLRL